MFQRTINKDLVRQNNPWLFERNRSFIVHNDIDGLLCALFLSNKLDWNLVGFYDLKCVWTDSTYGGTLFDPIYIDLDVTHSKAQSTGHHIVAQHGKHHLNPNILYNKSIENFETKYPLGEIFFLLWLYNENPPSNEDSWYWLLHADSSWKSYFGTVTEKSDRLSQIIKENVDDWLRNKLGFPPIADLLRNNTHDDIEKKIYNKILRHKFGRSDQFSFVMSNWDMERLKIVNLLNHLESIFSWHTIRMPTNVRKLEEFTNFTLSDYDEKMFGKVLPYFGEKIFSHGITYFNPPSMKISLMK
jgi:hypothetical protein